MDYIHSLPFFNKTFEFKIQKKRNEEKFTIFCNEFFSCFYFNENKIFVLYFNRCNSLKYQEKVNGKAEITMESNDISFKTKIQFSRKQKFVLFPNCFLPLTVKITLPYKHACKEPVPYVGIYNLGLTCYINSSIQLLNSCSPFTQLLYDQIPEKGTVTFELQKVFSELQSSQKAISIVKLIRAFGSNIYHMIAQEQDAHEFITALLDKIDTDLGKEFVKKREDVCGVIETRVLECPAAHIRNEVDELSNEIQVTVAGFDDLISSLREQTAVEKLTGNNQWDAGEKYGKQDAKRFIRYKKLPKVLLFHLVRVAYNVKSQRAEEVTNHFDCPEHLDMKEFCLKEVDKTKYTLVSVIAHRGDPNTGHYIAFAQPKYDGNWYLFNDSSVSKVTFMEVSKTFGETRNIIQTLLSHIGYGNFIAYLVAYIRNDQLKVKEKFATRLSTDFGEIVTARLITKSEIDPLEVYKSGEIVTVNDGNSCSIEGIFNNGNYNFSDDCEDDIISFHLSEQNNKKTEETNKTQPETTKEKEKSKQLTKKEIEKLEEEEKKKIQKQKEEEEREKRRQEKLAELKEIKEKKKKQRKLDLQDVNYFFSLPGINKLEGPIDKNTKCSDILLQNITVSLFAIPKSANNEPIFLINQNNELEIISKQELANRMKEQPDIYSSEYLLSDHRRVMNVSQLYNGSIVFILPQTVTFSINDKNHEFKSFATYEEIQESLDSKSPERVLLLSKNRPLLPSFYPTAYELSLLNNITVSTLPALCSVNSLPLYHRTNISFYDAKHNVKKTDVWTPIGSSLREISKILKEQYKIQHGEIVLSSASSSAINSILSNNSVLSYDVLRADLVDGQVCQNIKEIMDAFKSHKRVAIEVRHTSGSKLNPKSETLGFLMISENMTGNDIAHAFNIKNASNFIVRSYKDIVFSHIFDSKLTMNKLFQKSLAEIINDRPTIVIREMSEATAKLMKKK